MSFFGYYCFASWSSLVVSISAFWYILFCMWSARVAHVFCNARTECMLSTLSRAAQCAHREQRMIYLFFYSCPYIQRGSIQLCYLCLFHLHLDRCRSNVCKLPSYLLLVSLFRWSVRGCMYVCWFLLFFVSFARLWYLTRSRFSFDSVVVDGCIFSEFFFLQHVCVCVCARAHTFIFVCSSLDTFFCVCFLHSIILWC